MTMAELIKKSGFKRSTIHHYIRCGLLHDPYRTSQTMAYYDESHLERLNEIRIIKNNFIRTANTSRVPLDFVKSQIGETITRKPEQSVYKKQPRQQMGENKSKKKEEIIEAALVLYSKQGFYRTNIRDITKKVGISTPTFYHYFPDKRELFVEIIDYVIDDWKKKVAVAVQNEPDSRQRGIIRFRTFFEHYPRIGEVLNLLRAGVVMGDQWAKAELARVYRELMKNIVQGIKANISEGLYRKGDPEMLAYFFFIFDEAALQYQALENKYPIEELMLFVADLVAYGFMTEKGREIYSLRRQKTKSVRKSNQ
ncbi:MAG: TetR family transcriptional regulator [Deltaproteobacteria bacterium]|nr:TetR family transcriptional regulator [Deltaproteobacteria bacterium]